MTTTQKTSNLSATFQSGGAVAQRSSSVPAVVGNRKTRRAIKKVIDARGSESVLMPVDAVLDVLTSADLAAVRREMTSKKAMGEILFRCGQCNSPVWISSSPASSTGDGRGTFFKHVHRTPGGCTWHTPEALRSTGAKQFGGLQEGEPHWRLKTLLADSIRCDPDFTEPVVDKHFIRIGDGAASLMFLRPTRASRSPLSCSWPA